MKALRKVIILTFLVVLTSCSSFQAQPTITLHPSTTGLPTWTSTLELIITPSLLPTETRLPLQQTSSDPTLLTPTTTVMENGLTWTECVVPDRNYSMANNDIQLLTKCVERPEWSTDDSKIIGERVKGTYGFNDLRITIGKNHFESKLVDIGTDAFYYELSKNGKVLNKTSTYITTFDPNINLWNIDGKLVWELAGRSSVIIVDGINFNEKYKLEGSYFPYEIKGKLIYIAKKNDKLYVVYDGKIVGPYFDAISMPYCCAMVPLIRGNGQYWFVGSRGGTKYLVSLQ